MTSRAGLTTVLRTPSTPVRERSTPLRAAVDAARFGLSGCAGRRIDCRVLSTAVTSTLALYPAILEAFSGRTRHLPGVRQQSGGGTYGAYRERAAQGTVSAYEGIVLMPPSTTFDEPPQYDIGDRVITREPVGLVWTR